MTPAIQKVHLVFKTHLDVGFTALAADVVNAYFTRYIPQALAVARQLRASGSPERFTWTTGSWLIYEYLEQATAAARAEMEDAIRAGEIAWHGLPFTTYTEMMDASLFRHGLSLSQRLDRRFGRRTIAAKMTDVPGHSRAMLPYLAEAGIRFLHIGVNGASTPPDVPPVFRWREPGGAEIMVMYHRNYGAEEVIPGLPEAILFAHTGDNLGPQSVEAVQAVFADARKRFPGAEVTASTLDAFAARLDTVRENLPLVTSEIGDSWCHGVGSDPRKVADFRELQRLRCEWIESGRADPNAPTLSRFSTHLMCVSEHTWGMDIKMHLQDYEHYTPAALRAARAQPNFKTFESSWAEQRAYLTQAVSALGDTPLAEEARAHQAALRPAPPNLDGFSRLDEPAAPLRTRHFNLAFDTHGALGLLRHGRRAWGGENRPLGLLRYESFDQSDYDRFYRQYNKDKRHTSMWALPDFTKPGIAPYAVKGEWLPDLRAAWQRQETDGQSFVLELAFPAEPVESLGCPRRAVVRLFLPDAAPEVHFDVQWFEKQANRLPEALWFSFTPRIRQSSGWSLGVMGQSISPLDVVRDGSRHLHLIGRSVRYRDERGTLEIDSLDAALVAPGRRSLLDFNNRLPALSGGMHFNLYNNVWGTNHPVWYDENARFRFVLRVS